MNRKEKCFRCHEIFGSCHVCIAPCALPEIKTGNFDLCFINVKVVLHWCKLKLNVIIFTVEVITKIELKSVICFSCWNVNGYIPRCYLILFLLSLDIIHVLSNVNPASYHCMFSCITHLVPLLSSFFYFWRFILQLSNRA